MYYLVDHGSFGNLFRLVLKASNHDLQTSRPLPFGGFSCASKYFRGLLDTKTRSLNLI